MKTKVRPSIVGAFVLGAFGLGLIALLSFGSLNFLRQRERFVVLFDESIQGLTLGAPVKMSGVTLGRVVETRVTYDPHSPRRSAVEVIGEFDSNVLVDSSGHTIDVSKPEEVQALIDNGLRAQLTVTGLATGLAVVELGFFDPKLFPATAGEHSGRHPDLPVIPAITSTFSEFSSGAMEIVTNIKRIDFQALAANVQTLTHEVQQLVADARGKLDQIDVKALSAQWQSAGAAVTALASAPEVRQTFVTLNDTLADVRRAVNKVDNQVDANGRHLATTLAEAERTLKQFNASALTLQRFIAAQNGLGESATQALGQLGAAADSVQRLADFLERNPNALLSGRKPPPR